MNRLSRPKRLQILHMLVEGSSMRSISRVVGVSINTVTKLLVDAGETCRWHHALAVKGVHSRHIECDEIWSFCFAKEKNAPTARGVIDTVGDVWTWVGIDRDTKLILSWLVGSRDADSANAFMGDLASRLSNRIQLTTDGYHPYLDAVDGAFGGEIDYPMLVKLFGTRRQQQPSPMRRYSPAGVSSLNNYRISGRPNMTDVGTSYVERHNLTMRMSLRRFTRLTNAFSKKMENHAHAVARYTVWYNWCRPHMTLSRHRGATTPAMAAGLANRLLDIEWLTDLIEAVRY